MERVAGAWCDGDAACFRLPDQDQELAAVRLMCGFLGSPEFKYTPGHRRWELRLRPNVTFHDGSPLTSADVKFSIERTYDPNAKTAVANVFSTVERIETPDPLSVAFITKQPDACSSRKTRRFSLLSVI